MAQFTRVIWIKVDGVEQNVSEGGTFNPGGYEREAVSADNKAYVGYTEMPMASKVEVTARHNSETDLAAMSLWRNVTLEVLTDTGVQYGITGAALSNVPELSGAGEIKLEFIGPPAKKI